MDRTEVQVTMTNWAIPLTPRPTVGFTGEHDVTEFEVLTTPENGVTYYLEVKAWRKEPNNILFDKESDRLTVRLTSEMLGAAGIHKAQIVAYLTDGDDTPIKKSNIFEIEVKDSINATKDVEPHYQSALEQWNKKLDELGLDVDNLATKEEVEAKQDKLTAGENIEIDENGVISAKDDSGTTDYEDLDNKPQINSVELSGNKSLSDLGIQAELTDGSVTGNLLADGSVITNKLYSSITGTLKYGTGVITYENGVLTINYNPTNSAWSGGGFTFKLNKGFKNIIKATIDDREDYRSNWFVVGKEGYKTPSYYGVTMAIVDNTFTFTIPADVIDTAGETISLVNTSNRTGYLTLSNIKVFAEYVFDYDYLVEVLASIDYAKYKNKKILYLGDSITALAGERGWTTYFNEIIKPELAVNIAVASSRWCDYSDTVYDGNPVYNGADNNHNNTMGNQIEKLLRGKDETHPNYSRVEDYQDFDIIMISEGTNDSVPTENIEQFFTDNGAVVDISNLDKTKFGAAFRYAIENLQMMYSNAQIYICTPIQGWINKRSYDTTKARGDYLKSLANRISLEIIDTFECGICGIYEANNANGRDLIDGLHPNINGAKKIGKYNAKNIIDRYNN